MKRSTSAVLDAPGDDGPSLALGVTLPEGGDEGEGADTVGASVVLEHADAPIASAVASAMRRWPCGEGITPCYGGPGVRG